MKGLSIKTNRSENQVTAVVLNFMQIWNKFEATLSRELSRVNGNTQAIDPSRAHTSLNYGLFYRISSAISQNDSLSMGELSNTLAVPMSTATRIVDWLVDLGYVQRLPDPEDRRIVRVALTNPGADLHRTMDIYVRRRINQMLAGLDASERETLLSLVDKVVNALKDVIDK